MIKITTVGLLYLLWYTLLVILFIERDRGEWRSREAGNEPDWDNDKAWHCGSAAD